MQLEIKICGLTDATALDAACEAGANLVGLVLFPPSPRHVSLETGRTLAERARGRAGVVALTVDASDEEIDRIVEAIGPDFLQLHGQESPERCAELRRRHGLKVIKAFGIADAADVARIRPYLGAIDRVLVDAKPPKGASRPGGLGARFDWSLLDALGRQRPLMLSGGLDAGNVGEAIAVARPDAIDVSSGVESAPGRKDPAKIREFVAAVRAAEAAGVPVKEMR